MAQGGKQFLPSHLKGGVDLVAAMCGGSAGKLKLILPLQQNLSVPKGGTGEQNSSTESLLVEVLNLPTLS